MNRIKLKDKKDKKIRNHYPWIFPDDVATQRKDRSAIEDGSMVEVFDAADHFLGVGSYNSKSHILVRMFSRQNVPITPDFLHHRIRKAVAFRSGLSLGSNARRLVHSEGDLLPGLMVDQYADVAVVQLRTLAMERWADTIRDILLALLQPGGIYERSDMDSRRDEGLEKRAGLIHGNVPDQIVIEENGLRMSVDIRAGHKTGYYLDQRENRLWVRQVARPQQRFLDLFCYTGGFSIAAAAAGSYAVGVDMDPASIAAAKTNAALNGVDSRCEFIAADVFQFLDDQERIGREQPDRLTKYDGIIVDPPALAKRREGVERLKWTYWRLLSQTLPLLNDGGILALSSCAYHMSIDRMLEAARFASSDLRQRLRVVTITYQPPDHPWILQVPETLYLKTIYFQLLGGR